MSTVNGISSKEDSGDAENPVNGAVLAIADSEFTSKIQLLTYGWDVTRPAQSSFTPNQFSFAALQTADSPFLTQAVASGNFIDQLTLVDYHDVDGDGTGEAVAKFTLKDVVFTGYGQTTGELDLLVDTFQVSFGELNVESSQFDPQTGDFIRTNSSDFDVVRRTSSPPEDFGGIDLGEPSPQAKRILSFGELGDIQVSAFTAPNFKVDTGSSLGSGASAGLVTVDELVIETALNEATPDLIAALTSGTVLSDVVLSDYISIAGKQELLSQWDLGQAVVTSYAIASDETTGALPSVRFTLAPQTELTQTVNFDSDGNGSLDGNNQVSVKLDRLDVDFLGKGLSAQAQPAKPVNGAVLAITEAKQVSEIQLLSYGWEIMRPDQSQFDPSEFSFAALQTADSPFLTQAVASGTLIDQLTLVDYRDVDGNGTGEAVARFTLNDVVFTHYGQSSGENVPVDTFQVNFGHLEINYDQFDPQTGDFIGSNSSNFDVVSRTSSPPGDFGGTDLVNPSLQAERILSFGDLGDIRVNAFTAPTLRVDTSGSSGGGARTELPTVNELVVETALNEATPDLIAALTSGTVLPDVVLSDYVSIVGLPELLSQWELSQAIVTSYAITSDATDATAQSTPIVRFSLAPQAKLTQTVNLDSDQDGSLDSSNRVLLDVASGTVTSSSVDGNSQLASIPQDSLTGTRADSMQVGDGEDWTDTHSKLSSSFDPAIADTHAMQNRALNSLDDVGTGGQYLLDGLMLDDSSRFQGRGDSSAATFGFFDDGLMGAIAPVTDVSTAEFNNSIPFG
ncbi:MAG: type VI secretion system tube protein Hcp [Cyanobacteria bacterium J06626_18]